MFYSAVLLSMAAVVQAAQVSWGTEAQSTDLDSSGAGLSEEWIFELGAFAPGFTPASSNTSQWKVQWTTASRTAYDEVNRAVAGPRFTFTSNASPYTTTNRGWIWGYHPRRGEWILFGDTTWRWPSASQPGLPPAWGTLNARDVIVGTLNSAGVQMRTAPVAGATPSISWSVWQTLYFNATERTLPAVSGPDADPDGDGLTNAVEYLTGSVPRRVSTFPASFLPGTTVEVRLSASATGTLWGQVSSDLTLWLGNSDVLVTPVTGALRFAPSNPSLFSGRIFWRFGAVLP